VLRRAGKPVSKHCSAQKFCLCFETAQKDALPQHERARRKTVDLFSNLFMGRLLIPALKNKVKNTGQKRDNGTYFGVKMAKSSCTGTRFFKSLEI